MVHIKRIILFIVSILAQSSFSLADTGHPLEYYRAIARMEQGENQAALTILDSLYRLNGELDYAIGLCRAYIYTDKLDSAQNILTLITKRNPSTPILLLRAELAAAQRRFRDAVDTIALLLQAKEPIYPSELYCMKSLDSLRRSREWDSLFSTLYRPNAQQILCNRLLYLCQNEEWEGILETLNEFKGSSKRTGKLAFYECLAYYRIGEIDKAYRLIKKIIDYKRVDLPSSLLYAEILQGRGEWKKALRVLNTMEAQEPNAPQLLLAKGKVLHYSGRWAESTQYLNRYLSIESNNASALQIIISNHRELKEWAQALGRCQQLLRVCESSQRAEAQLLRCSIIRMSGNARVALEQLDKISMDGERLLPSITMEKALCLLALSQRAHGCALLNDLKAKGDQEARALYERHCLRR